MNVIRVTSQIQQFEHLQCRRCNTVLPVSSTFCGKCGMRVNKDEMPSKNTPLPASQSDIAARYRITSLVRRRPGIQLSFAIDMQRQNLVVLRDIDVSGLDETARELAYAELQQEYELLEYQHIADLTPLIASCSYEGHLYSIADWPFSLSKEKAPVRTMHASRPYTLQDLLQSGVGLPKERIAISWIRGLAVAVERLHECQISIGELDPDTIIISSHDYSGQPALIVSWIPIRLRHALSQISNAVYPSNFRAPETLDGQQDGLSDIYSLGALLYLLLTGIAPDPVESSNSSRNRQRTPRDLNPHISSALATIVMQAIASDPDKRFQHASELEEALHQLQKGVHMFRLPQITFVRPPKSTPKFGEETPVSFDMDNNENSVSKEAQLVEESNDKTIQTRDIQEQLARSYLSRINTGPLISQEKQTGEATVDKVPIQEKQTEDVIEGKAISQGPEEMPTSKNKQVKKGKKRSNRKYRVSDKSSAAELQAKTTEIAEASAQVMEVSEKSSNDMPFQEVDIDTPTEEVCIVSLSKHIEEMRTASEGVEEVEEQNAQKEMIAVIEGINQQVEIIAEVEEVAETLAEAEGQNKQNEAVAEVEEVAETLAEVEEVKETLAEVEEVKKTLVEVEEVKETLAEVEEVAETLAEAEEQNKQNEAVAGVEEVAETLAEAEEQNKQNEAVAGVEEVKEALAGVEEVTETLAGVEEVKGTLVEAEEVKGTLVGIEEQNERDETLVEAEEVKGTLVGIEEQNERDETLAGVEQVTETLVGIEEQNERDEELAEVEQVTEAIAKVKEQNEREEKMAEVEELNQQGETIVGVKELKETLAEVEQVTEAIAKVKEQNQREEAIEELEEVTSKQESVHIEKKVAENKKEDFREESVLPTSQALQSQSISRSDMLPAILPGKSKERALARIKDLFIGTRSLLAPQIQPTEANTDESFLQRVQRFILGEQKHATMAVALIEMPMRIQPTQSYAIRIQIIGRDQQTDETQTGGLSALTYKDIVHIEVRLALYQNYAYMVQQADVAIPASGYAAEVMMPMFPLASGPSSRRERLQIFFMDKDRNPLYEKPFVIEIFVSPIVQLGNEGHNVLSIPL